MRAGVWKFMFLQRSLRRFLVTALLRLASVACGSSVSTGDLASTDGGSAPIDGAAGDERTSEPCGGCDPLKDGGSPQGDAGEPARGETRVAWPRATSRRCDAKPRACCSNLLPGSCLRSN